MVRKLQEADIDRVAEIWLDTNIRTHPFIAASYWRDHFEAVKGLLLQTDVYVYEEQNEIQGFDRSPRDIYRMVICLARSTVPRYRQRIARLCEEDS